MKGMHGLAVGVGLSLLVIGCGADEDGTKEARSDRGRILAPRIGEEALAAQVQASNRFAFDLYANLYQEPGNLLFSPYLVRSGLGAVYGGAAKNTAAQMRQALGLDAEVEELFSALDQLDLELDGRKDGPVRFESESALWLRKGQKVAEPYLDFLSLYYGAGVRFADFARDPAGAKGEIDRFASGHRGGSLDPWIRMLSSSVFRLQGALAAPVTFLPEGPFQLLDGTAIQVPTLAKAFPARVAQGERWRALALPLAAAELTLLLLVPDPGQLRELERALSPELLAAVLADLEPRDLVVRMPRLALASDGSLHVPLLELGMKDAFSAGLADFSGISDDPELFLARVQHLAAFSLAEGEDGGAASSSVAPDAGEGGAVVEIDRPFVFFVLDRTRGTALLVGRVVKP